jgi:hypothetical protein
MFVTTSSKIPSNWVVQLRSDGALEIGPEAWLTPGFWEEYLDHQRAGPAADSYGRELEVILRES